MTGGIYGEKETGSFIAECAGVHDVCDYDYVAGIFLCEMVGGFCC